MSGPARRPWWERWLLEVELGRIDDDTDEGALTGVPAPRSPRDWIVDLVMFAYAGLAAFATVVNDRAGLSSTMVVVTSGLAAVACLALWARRRAPLPVAWLTIVLAAASPAAVHACLLAIFSAAVHGRPRRASAAAVGAIVAIGIDCLVLADPGRSFNGDFFVVWSLMTLAAFAFGSFIRVRRELFGELRGRAHRAQAEQRLRVREARLAERTQIAREMHDVLAHRISLLAVHAGALEFNADADREELTRGLGVIRGTARSAQQELREVLGVLRAGPEEAPLDPPQPTIADLGPLVAESRAAGMRVTLDDRLPMAPLPGLLGRTAYRVAQEGLTNARKHAPADAVLIEVGGEPDGVLDLLVVNRPATTPAMDGAVDSHVGSGTGLVGLAERVSLLGGTLAHGPREDGGFELRATIPWPRDGGGEEG